MQKFNILFYFTKRNYIVNKLNAIKAIIYEPSDILRNYLFVRNLDNDFLKKIENMEDCYFLKKLGSNELATISLKELSIFHNSLKVKKTINLKNKLVKILRGSFKDQCGKCISNNSKTATIKTFLFNSRETNLTIPIKYLTEI